MDTARNYGIAPVAQWIRRLPTEQEILGSIPGGGTPTIQIFFFDSSAASYRNFGYGAFITGGAVSNVE